jgi:hypothetical protein
MNFTNNLGAVGYFSCLTCFKLLIILALFFLHLYLYFSEPKEYAIKECGINDKLLIKKIFSALVGLSSFYGGYAGYKGITYNELEKVRMEALYQKQRQEHLDILFELSAKYTKGEIQSLNEKEFTTKYIYIYLVAFNSEIYISELKGDSLLRYTTELKKLAYKNITSPEDQLANKKQIDYISNTFYSDSKVFGESNPEYQKILLAFRKVPEDTFEGAEEISSSSKLDADINESFMFSTITSSLIENYENMDSMSKIALGLLLLNYALISSLISIIFIFYGDYLIKKYKIEVNYPKLAKIISLRRKFQKYYLIVDFLIIISVILSEIVFCIAFII